MENQTYGVGIIGAGLRGAVVMGARIADLAGSSKLRVKALCDKLPARMDEMKFYLDMLYLDQKIDNKIVCHLDYRKLVDDPRIDLILVTTPTHAHLAPALYALDSGKKVYLDKPIAVTLEDAAAIVQKEEKTGNRLLMGFTRRYENTWTKARSLLEEGAIGQLQMMQIRSVIPYTRYYQMWFRRNKWSGGALNDKSSHHFDVFNWLAKSRCVKLSALGGRSPFFKPDPAAPERCLDCDRDCPYNIFKDPDLSELGITELPPSWADAADEADRADNCVYLPGCDITDHVICQLEYENSIKASLFLCIFGPRADDQETLELVGERGRLVLCRETGLIDLFSDYGQTHELIDTKTETFASSHFGADLALVREMENFMQGAPPVASVWDGLESLRMVTAAQKSIDNGGVQVAMKEIKNG